MPCQVLVIGALLRPRGHTVRCQEYKLEPISAPENTLSGWRVGRLEGRCLLGPRERIVRLEESRTVPKFV